MAVVHGAERPQVIHIPNGEPVVPMFSTQEMERRVSGLRGLMASLDVDATLFTSIHNINYFTDFLYCSFGRNYGLVVTPRARRRSAPTSTAASPTGARFGDNVVYTDWQRDNYFRAAAGLLAGVAPRRRRVRPPHAAEPRQARGGASRASSWSTSAPARWRMRMVKSAEEIAVIRNGARIADIGGAACVEAIGEGVPEYEVALHATQAMVREIAATYPHAELMDTWTWFQSGINTDGAHNPVTTRRIERGDILSLNCFPMIQGYYTALERTLFSRLLRRPLTASCGRSTARCTAAGSS